MTPAPEAGRRRSFRSLVMPAVILVVAGALLVWGRQAEEQTLHGIRAEVVALCRDIMSDQPTPRVQALRDRPAGDLLLRALEGALEVHEGEDGSLSVTISARDAAPPVGDGTATHTALVYIDDRPRIGLRLEVEPVGRGLQVLGVWQP